VVLLSVCRGVVGWGCPNSSKAVQIGHRFWAVRNKAPSSALAALEMTCHIIWQRTWMAPLSGGAGSEAVGGVVGRELKNE